MTYQSDFTLSPELLEQIVTNGFAYLPEIIREMINMAMRFERQQYLEAAPYQRIPERQDQANGYKPKTVKTRVGEITFDVPQVRNGGFYPIALEKVLRSERALMLTHAEMYIQGVSTRKVKAVLEQLCGAEVSAAQVSKATAQMDEAVEAWRQSPLFECPYLFLDARYEKVRQDSLVNRGLRGVQLMISDDHAGLKAARITVFGGIPWQRCQFHLKQNVSAYVPKRALLSEVAADIRAIFNTPDLSAAEAYLQKAVHKCEKSASKLARWMKTNKPGCSPASNPNN